MWWAVGAAVFAVLYVFVVALLAAATTLEDPFGDDQ